MDTETKKQIVLQIDPTNLRASVWLDSGEGVDPTSMPDFTALLVDEPNIGAVMVGQAVKAWASLLGASVDDEPTATDLHRITLNASVHTLLAEVGAYLQRHSGGPFDRVGDPKECAQHYVACLLLKLALEGKLHFLCREPATTAATA